MAKRKNKRKPKNSNVKKSEVNTKSTELKIEKFKFYSVVVQVIVTLIISFKDQILKWFS